MLVFSVVIGVILSSSPVLKASEERRSLDIFSAPDLLVSWIETLVEEILQATTNYAKHAEVSECTESVGMYDMTKETRQQISGCIMGEKSSFKRCISDPLARTMFELKDIFSNAIGCIPMVLRVKSYYNSISLQKLLFSKNFLKEISASKPETTACVNEVLARTKFIALNGILDIGRCADFRTVSSVECLDTVNTLTYYKLQQVEDEANLCD